MSEHHAYTTYRSYRIYLPREGNFSLDADERHMVHVEIASAETGSHEYILIAGCVADTYDEACVLSVEQAHIVVDSRTGAVTGTPRAGTSLTFRVGPLVDSPAAEAFLEKVLKFRVHLAGVATVVDWARIAERECELTIEAPLPESALRLLVPTVAIRFGLGARVRERLT